MRMLGRLRVQRFRDRSCQVFNSYDLEVASKGLRSSFCVPKTPRFGGQFDVANKLDGGTLCAYHKQLVLIHYKRHEMRTLRKGFN